MKKIREWMNIQLVKNPGMVVLAGILLFNVVFFLLSAVFVKYLSLTGTENMSFVQAMYYTITMILDAGCIEAVVTDIGQANVILVIVCIFIIVVGMISFTGAVIGYITNWISGFIDNATSSTRRLKIYNHSVILNWNNRASEIINDLLYCDKKQKVIILVDSNKEAVEKEINERISDTIAKENAAVIAKGESMPFLKRISYISKNRFKKNIVIIVREGDVFSSKQLNDISIAYARMIIILGSDVSNSICEFKYHEALENRSKGNSLTIKTLMQVSDITSAEYSSDNQKIIVEVTDQWTKELVDKIIKYKQVDKKCNIVPVMVNEVLGNILAQFSLMPELNSVYSELFSNRGMAFYSQETTNTDEEYYIKNCLETNNVVFPLSIMEKKGQKHMYYSALSEKDIYKKYNPEKNDYTVKLNKNYWIVKKNVIILGHNSRTLEIMKGFNAFKGEWKHKDNSEEIVEVIVIDNKDNLEKMNHYKEYSFVTETIEAEIYDKDLICSTIDKFISKNQEDISVLILSDDTALKEDIDANALANLVYVQDIIRKKKLEEDFNESRIDIIVEIINPKHHDIVNSYSVNNVVISNKYISKMTTQIGEKEALFDFFTDILTYDDEDSEVFNSKEIYIKQVRRFFDELPKECTADELVKAVYYATVDSNLPAKLHNPTMVLGYVDENGKVELFSGDRTKIKVRLNENCKIIVFSNH